MKPLEVWTCQRAENLKKLSNIPKNNYAATMVSAARRKIIGGGADKLSAAAARRSTKVCGGGAHKFSTAAHCSNWKESNVGLIKCEPKLPTLITYSKLICNRSEILTGGGGAAPSALQNKI